MLTYHENDAAALSARLNELKIKFDQRMLNGDSFAEVKKIYLEIKKIETQLHGVSKFLKPY